MTIIFRVAFALAVVISVMSVAGTSAPGHWIGELLAQPRPQYIIGLVLCGIPMVWRYPRAGWCVVLPILFNSYYVAPLYLSPERNVVLVGMELTVLHANVDRFNSQPARAIDWVRAQRADIVSLQEVTPAFEKSLGAALPDYAVVLSHPMKNSHGSAVLVRRDAAITKVSARIIHLPETSERLLIEYVFRLQDREVALLSFHVTRPVGRDQFAYQSLELGEAAKWARAQYAAGRGVIVLGDLNIAPWSSRFKALCADGNLINSQIGFGLQSSWPAALPSIAGLPIDHCLHSTGFVTVSRLVGPAIGSDHWPLLVQLQVTERS
ncbi:MAG: endonuclease/exonuclease/phosphatase family protein [Candidatus Hydrogenedentes bacterium]|nr:endonuclease/exonuclease/phosphatase family protein [Candidatus Hydrogenedentota bacterium]